MESSLAVRRAGWCQNPFSGALSEDLAPAQDGIAAETTGNYQELYDPPREWEVGHAASIAAMDTSLTIKAHRTV